MKLRVKRVDGKEAAYDIDYLRPVERTELDRMLRQEYGETYELQKDALEFHRRHLVVSVLSKVDNTQIIDQFYCERAVIECLEDEQ